MNPNADELPFLGRREVQAVLELLDRDGEEARVVGGAVRNALLRLPAADVDVATTATPDVVLRRARAGGLRTVPTGLDHGTVTVIAEGRPFEVTTLREDIETDGRHAVVRFGRDFALDAMRRDFTINALYADRRGMVHDHVGGRSDLAARRVRFIGDAGRRIAEDHLRILRFFRFSAAYGRGRLDPEGLEAVTGAAPLVATVAGERIRQELAKLLVAPHATDVLEGMARSGVLRLVVGPVADIDRLAALDASAGFDWLLRLAALTGLDEDTIGRLMRRLRLSRLERRRLEVIAAALPDMLGQPRPDDGTLRRWLYRLGPAIYADTLRLVAAYRREPLDALAAGLPEAWLPPARPFSGDTFKAAGVPPGEAIGRALQDAERRWIEAGFPVDEATVAAIVTAVASDSRRP